MNKSLFTILLGLSSLGFAQKKVLFCVTLHNPINLRGEVVRIINDETQLKAELSNVFYWHGQILNNSQNPFVEEVFSVENTQDGLYEGNNFSLLIRTPLDLVKFEGYLKYSHSGLHQGPVSRVTSFDIDFCD